MKRPVADLTAAGKGVGAFVAVTVVLLMHGLVCMAGASHVAGMAGHPPA